MERTPNILQWQIVFQGGRTPFESRKPSETPWPSLSPHGRENRKSQLRRTIQHQRNPLYGLTYFLLMVSAFASAQTAPPPPLVSPDVHADGSVTLRVRDLHSQRVLFDLEGSESVIDHAEG